MNNFTAPSLDQDVFFSTQERFIGKKIIPSFLFKPKGVLEFEPVDLFQEKNNKEIGPKRLAVSSSSLLKIEAESAIVVGRKGKRTLFNKDINKVLPIASISKLMTALVFLDTNPDWDSYYQITSEDRREGGKIYLYLGERVKIINIFNTSLSASANSATIALVNSAGFSEDEFVKKMNKKALDLGLFKTKFKDATGLSEENVSTSWEISKLASEALLRDEIKRAVSLKDYSFETEGGREKNIESTDDLLGVFPLNNIGLIGGKTGYNKKAGFCFVGIFQKNNNDLITVIMGAEEESVRFDLAKKLTLWAFNNYKW
ncbi:hypothetical protein K8R62_01245 [bacterium]|nr:hypothetical protein [bacterium]